MSCEYCVVNGRKNGVNSRSLVQGFDSQVK